MKTWLTSFALALILTGCVVCDSDNDSPSSVGLWLGGYPNYLTIVAKL